MMAMETLRHPRVVGTAWLAACVWIGWQFLFAGTGGVGPLMVLVELPMLLVGAAAGFYGLDRYLRPFLQESLGRRPRILARPALSGTALGSDARRRCVLRRLGPLLAVAGLLALAPPTGLLAEAAVGGRPIGNRPYVGALVVAHPPARGAVAWCSGVLVAPTVFLTAAHCTTVLPESGGVLLGVTFDAVFDPASSPIVPGTAHANPAYDPAAPGAATRDLAVIRLAQAPAGVEPATLPEGDLGAGLALLPDLRDAPYAAVGYDVTGFLADAAGGPAFDLQAYGTRRTAPLTFHALVGDALLLAGTAFPPLLAGAGTPCFGDSGGPVFLGETPVLLPINTATSLACAEPFAFTRLDTAAARTFLAPFLEYGGPAGVLIGADRRPVHLA